MLSFNSAILTSLIGSLWLSLIFFSLYLVRKERYLLTWTFGWLTSAGMLLLETALYFGGPHRLLLLLSYQLALLSALLLLAGTQQSFHAPLDRQCLWAAGLTSAWIVVGALFFPPSAWYATAPPALVIGGIIAWIGYLTLTHPSFTVSGKLVTGAAFVLWGLLKMVDPFLEGMRWNTPWFFFLDTLLSFSVALGFIIIHFSKKQRELVVREERLEAIFDDSLVGIAIIRPDGTLEQVNSRLAALVAAARPNLLDTAWHDLLLPEDQSLLRQPFDALVRGKLSSTKAVVRLQRAVGEPIWAQCSLSLIRDRSEFAPRSIMALFIDLSDQVQAEQALDKKAHQLDRLIATAQELTQTLNLEEVLTQIGLGARELLNAYGCAIYLLEPDGHTLTPVIDLEPDYTAQIMATPLTLDNSLTGKCVKNRRAMVFNNPTADEQAHQIPGTPVETEERLLCAPLIAERQALGAMTLNRIGIEFSAEEVALGETFAAYASTALKNVQTYGALLRETEERRAAERARQESEDIFRTAFQTNPDSINITRTVDGKIVSVNDGFLRISGYTLEDTLGKNMLELNVWADPDERQQLVTTLKRDGRVVNMETRLRRKDGSTIVCLISAAQLTLRGEVHMVTVTRDINDRKLAEQRLQESEERHRALFETTHSVMLLVDSASLAILDANPEAIKFYGFSKRQLTQMRLSDLSLAPHEFALTDEHHFSTQQRLASGEPRWVEVYASPLIQNGQRVLYAIIHDITQRIQAEREKETLVVISKALRTVQTRAEMVPVLLQELVASMGASGAALAAQTVPGQPLCFEAAVGALAALQDQLIDSEYGVVLQAIQSGRPYLNLDVAAEPVTLLPDAPQPPKTLAVVPLIAKDETVGALLFSRDAETAENDLRTLQTVAEIAANALQRETLHDQITQQAANLAALNAVGRSLGETLKVQEIYARLAKAVTDLIPDIGVLLVSQYDPPRRLLEPVYALIDGQMVEAERFPNHPVQPEDGEARDGEDPLTQPLRTRRPSIVNRLHASALHRLLPTNGERLTQSAMLIPLLAKGEVLGMLHLQSYALDRFSQDDAELLAIIGNTAAVSLKNAVLFEETQNRLKRLDALHNIDKAITTNFELDVTLQVVLQQTIERLGVDAAIIYLLDDSGQTLIHRAASGLRSPVNDGRQLPLAGSLAGKILHLRRVIYLPDLADRTLEDEVMLDVPADEGFRSYFGAPLLVKDQARGVLALFQRTPSEPDQEWYSFLETLARQTAIAIENASLFKKLQQSNLDLTLAYDKTLEGWAKALELRDKETQGHSTRVTDLTIYLAAAMGISGDALVHIRRGSLLHDIGKMGIPDSILLNSGPLSATEWEVMRQHPRYAYDLLNTIPFLRPALDIPYCHHEKWDGSGYPRGLQGPAIPLAARIFAVIDVWDALLDDRPYRRAWDLNRVNAYIRAQSGTHFDPAVVETFFALNLAPFERTSDKIAA